MSLNATVEAKKAQKYDVALEQKVRSWYVPYLRSFSFNRQLLQAFSVGVSCVLYRKLLNLKKNIAFSLILCISSEKLALFVAAKLPLAFLGLVLKKVSLKTSLIVAF